MVGTGPEPVRSESSHSTENNAFPTVDEEDEGEDQGLRQSDATSVEFPSGAGSRNPSIFSTNDLNPLASILQNDNTEVIEFKVSRLFRNITAFLFCFKMMQHVVS